MRDSAPRDGDAVAAAIGHPARGTMLSALFGGRALPAADLARAARVSPSAARAQPAQLAAAGLVAVERQGRHRYHRLARARRRPGARDPRPAGAGAARAL